MIVTAIEIVDKEKMRIYIDEEKAFVLYRGDIFKLRIRVNTEMTEDTYNYIMNEIFYIGRNSI